MTVFSVTIDAADFVANLSEADKAELVRLILEDTDEQDTVDKIREIVNDSKYDDEGD